MYYKRQLNNYNLTIFDLGTEQGYSYLWNETTASRGGCEIASCVYSFIKLMVSKGKKKIFFFPDNCIAQNKNRYYLTMLWYCMYRFELTSICHKYLEKGHTQNENDTMHSLIERASIHIEIFSTTEWAAVIKCACRKKPYLVTLLEQSDIYDFKALSENFRSFEYTTEKGKVLWKNIRLLHLTKDDMLSFYFQYEYGGNKYCVNLLGLHSTRSESRAKLDMSKMQLKQLRNRLIPISIEKYNDLLSLCISDLIPRTYHLFYNFLPHS